MSKFKIGDRVHYDDRLTKGVGTIHLRAPENEGFDWGVAVAEHDRMYGYHKGNIRWFLARDLRPAFTVEPGRHYRTRNGKVTGRVPKGDTGFETIVDGKVRVYDAAGGHVHGDADLDIVEAWQPRVGERVRYRNALYGEAIVKEVLPDGRFVVDTEGKFGTCTERLKSLEPILTTTTPKQPATLKIEAGKFYKTRDGRKVGPMERREGYLFHEGWHYNASGECCYRGRSGDCVQKDREIIAEWIDEPVAASNDNAKPKFKVGDRISGYAPAFGAVTGIITAFDNSSPTQTYMIRDDKSGHTMWVDNYSIELITTPTTTAIVALIENGQPKPSSTPHVHTSTGAAEKEAKRLAGKYKGQQFGVFKLTTAHSEARVYEHEWQRMASDGKNNIAAAVSLMKQAGIDHGNAIAAVHRFVEKAA